MKGIQSEAWQQQAAAARQEEEARLQQVAAAWREEEGRPLRARGKADQEARLRAVAASGCSMAAGGGGAGGRGAAAAGEGSGCWEGASGARARHWGPLGLAVLPQGAADRGVAADTTKLPCQMLSRLATQGIDRMRDLCAACWPGGLNCQKQIVQFMLGFHCVLLNLYNGPDVAHVCGMYVNVIMFPV